MTTTTTKFTPGPWVIEVDEHPIPSTSDILIQSSGGDTIAEVWWTTDPDGDKLANAALIAAAPELLEVLINVVAFASLPLPDFVLSSALRTIRKAEGR